MNNINLSHFYFFNNLRIIHTVDEGHHLNVLLNSDKACDPNPHALFLKSKTSARKGPNKSIGIKNLLLVYIQDMNMKKSIKKTNLLVALFATTLLSTVATAAVPKSTLIKAEPVNQTQLTSAAHSTLKLSLAPVEINYTQQSTDSGLAKQKQSANQNKSVTLTKVSLIAD